MRRSNEVSTTCSKTNTPKGAGSGDGASIHLRTWSVLCCFNAVGLEADHPSLRRGVDWLIKIQNQDGGWGEDDSGYGLDYKAYKPSASTPSQTSWAVIGPHGGRRGRPSERQTCIAYLERCQAADWLWREERYTGTGFPRVFYLRYLGYAKFFPIWALARYRNLKSGNTATVQHGCRLSIAAYERCVLSSPN